MRDIGKDLFEEHYQRIRNRIQKLNIRALLRKRAKALEKAMGANDKAVQALKAGINKGEREISCFHPMPDLVAFTMIHWAFDTSGQVKGYGFPFDLPHLVFYQRLQRIYSVIEQIRHTSLHRNKSYRPLFQLFRLIHRVMEDPTLSKSVAQMEERVEVFENLRKALRIALPEGKKGLNDDGEDTDIKTIKEKVEAFREQLRTDSHFLGKDPYRKMIRQIDTYWEKLFADPIAVDTPNGRVFIQPQRTNNTLERFFRDFKRRNRRKSGTVSLTKTLKTILSDTPLVKNLDNEEYLSIILDGCNTLEERFSKIDSHMVVEEFKEAQKKSERLRPELKKMIREPEFLEKLRPLFTA